MGLAGMGLFEHEYFMARNAVLVDCTLYRCVESSTMIVLPSHLLGLPLCALSTHQSLLLLPPLLHVLDSFMPPLLVPGVLARMPFHPTFRTVQIPVAAQTFQICIIQTDDAPCVDLVIGWGFGVGSGRGGEAGGNRWEAQLIVIVLRA